MNNKLNNNFSLRKLLLTALVAGPLATLPAPLWALPDISSSNLTASAGVNPQTTLNITAPDKAILTWQAFGSGSSAIAFGDVINYFLPSATSSVLNTVSGGVASTISGQILSNGNVYILNPAGIVITPTAQINVGGFYASTVAEPSGFFSINGSLSFAGSSSNNVVVQGTGVTSSVGTVAGDVATIQAIGPGNNIYLAGAGVNVQGAKIYGNLFVRSTSTLTSPLASGPGAELTNTGVNTSFGSTGPVSINTVGVSATGGGLNVTTGGGNISLTGVGSLTVSPGVTATPPAAVSINTVGSSVNGNITQGAGLFTASTTGSVVTLNASTGTTAGNITLNNVDFLTVGSSGNAISIVDKAGDLALAATNANGNLSITTQGAVVNGVTFGNIASAGTVTVGGTIAISTPANTSVSVTAAGNVTFSSITTASTLAITSSGDVNVTAGSVTTGRNMTIVSTGGQITANALAAGSTLTLTASSSAGKITATNLTSRTGNFTATGDIQIGNAVSGGLVVTSGGTVSITSSTGNITAGTVTNGSALTLTATQGSITTGAISANSGLTLTAANGSVSTGAITAVQTVTLSSGNITTGAISTTSAFTATASSGSVTTSSVTTTAALSLTATNGSITVGTITSNSSVTLSAPSAGGSILTSTITSTIPTAGAQLVSLTSGGSINIAATGPTGPGIVSTIPFLSVTSTGGYITQNQPIISSSKATFNAAGDITLTSATNDFNVAVLVGGASSTSGIALVDANNIIIGGGTNTKAATSITTGSGGAANIVLGASSIDALVFGSTLSLTAQGAATTGAISTNANTLTVFGNVNITTTNNNTASLGSNIFGNAANYGFGQITANVGTGGTLNVYESTTLNLGNITAQNVDARSLNGDIVNTGKLSLTAGGTATFSAGTIFAPANISLNTVSNALAGNVVIGNAKDFTLTNTVSTTVTAGSPSVNGKAATGSVFVTVTGANTNTLTIDTNTLTGGDLNIVGFNAPGAVVIKDPNGLTLQNLTNTAASNGAVSVKVNGPITLGSGIALGGTGTTTFTSLYNANAPTHGITDTAAGIRIFGESTFLSDGNISVTQAGHSFGTVNLTTTGVASAKISPVAASGTMGLQNITFTEGGTLVLKTVSVGGSPVVVPANTNFYPGSLTLTSTGGSIVQAAGGTIAVPTVSGANPASFTSSVGSVVLNNPGNHIDSQVNITAVGNSSYTQGIVATGANYLTLGNISISAGTLNIDTSAASAGKINQWTGTSIKSYGNATFTTLNGSINLTNTGNNFGGLTLLTNKLAVASATATQAAGVLTTIANTTPGTGYTPNSSFAVTLTGGGAVTQGTAQANTDANGTITSYTVLTGGAGYTSAPTVVIGAAPVPVGADVSVTETGVLNLLNVNTGTGGKFAATSDAASIIQSGNGGILVGGATTLSAPNGSINLNTTTTNNVFGGINGISITTGGNVSIQDAAATTAIAGGTTVGGTTTLKNSFGGGEIRDLPGNITLTGNVVLDTGTAALARINLGTSNLSMGAVKFTSNTVTIIENNVLNLASGSTALGPVSLTAAGSIITSGTGGSNFQSTLILNASGGSITITNPISVTNGLTFRATGAVDLSILSLAANLNSIAPTNLSASSYKAPGF
ncbi:MAG: S-layer family protein [Verrucomicrobia bacterium]|nr:S-layer family protein [Verrucomicrobiota bacterium]